jgi:polysaccharide export outer membrane protein
MSLSFNKIALFLVVVFGHTSAAVSQEPALTPAPLEERFPSYILGPGDEIVIMALNAEEVSNKPIRIPSEGEINLPMVGRIRVAGMTIEELEDELGERLKVYIKEPDVAVHVARFQGQPVSVLGAVGSPGIVQLEGRKSLLEVLSMAGGLQENHGARLTITRRSEFGPVPLPSATPTLDGDFSVAELNIRSIMDASHPEQNIQILPHDVISVPTAEVVYVMGQVGRTGGFTLEDQETMSVLQALALAQGLSETARGEDGRIIRQVADAPAVEIEINLDDLLRGKITDVALHAGDILFVPDSFARGALRRALDSAISAATSMVIYRRF